MVDTKQTGKPIDFSIMPSFKCNLECWFCMYDGGPSVQKQLDYDKTKAFLATFDWSQINAFGFYGGEPSIDMPLYDKFIDLVPHEMPKFVITNGTWSKNTDETTDFIHWCAKQRLHVIVSSTPVHIEHQARNFLENLETKFDGAIELKRPDDIHAQGRAKGKDGVISDCRMTCERTDRNIRLGLKPDGTVVYQNCHGEYLIIQTYEQPFDGIADRVQSIVSLCVKSHTT